MHRQVGVMSSEVCSRTLRMSGFSEYAQQARKHKSVSPPSFGFSNLFSLFGLFDLLDLLNSLIFLASFKTFDMFTFYLLDSLKAEQVKSKSLKG